MSSTDISPPRKPMQIMVMIPSEILGKILGDPRKPKERWSQRFVEGGGGTLRVVSLDANTDALGQNGAPLDHYHAIVDSAFISHFLPLSTKLLLE